ncbi:7667_t:CDS:2 [Paraglomus brasilianum]|uniref:7667_t:CDS:1 n=1 Tax=Paraglomus brasilianum TaxID=144538 RepID=A0A9N9GP97_9GLOM|nr:7667_t:CDS:2 [Paraglomus brasilianum]
MSEPNINNNHVRLYDNVYQPEDFNFDNISPPIQMQAQDVRPHATSFSLDDMTYMNTNSPSQMLQAQPHTQDVRPPATFFPFSGSVVSIDYGNTGSHTTSHQDDAMNEQLTSSREQVESHSSCPLCGSSNGHFGTISSQSITYTLTPMRTQASLSFNNSSLEYLVIKEVRIQSVLDGVPAASISALL